jgi:hypothetical protein
MAKSSKSAPRGWTDAEWKRMQPGAEASSAAARLWPSILSARYDAPSQLVVLQLSNGARFGISAERLEGVALADDERRSLVVLAESGAAIEFPLVGERFRVSELLTGVFGSRAWVADLERRAAAPPSPAKPAMSKRAAKTSKPVKKPASKAKKKRPKLK